MKSPSVVLLKENKPHGTKAFRCAFYQEQSASDPLIVKHHWHDEVELVYFEKGSFSAEINMERLEFSPGGLMFLNAGELHYIRSAGGFKESAFVFDPHILSFECYDLVQSQLIDPLQNKSMKFPRYIASTDDIFEELHSEYICIMEAFHNKNILTDEGGGLAQMLPQIQVKAALLKIFAVLSRESLLEPMEGSINRQVEEIKQILSYIHNHYSERIYIKDLSGILNVNEQYFCRLFKKVIGKSAMEYVNEVRIKHAKHLLRSTNQRVMDICLECGFNNLGNFLREFKKQTRTTPHTFRKDS